MGRLRRALAISGQAKPQFRPEIRPLHTVTPRLFPSLPPNKQDPTSPDFGASVFESKAGTEGGSFPLGDAHSEYFQKENDSLRHMGKIIAGQNKRD